MSPASRSWPPARSRQVNRSAPRPTIRCWYGSGGWAVGTAARTKSSTALTSSRSALEGPGAGSQQDGSKEDGHQCTSRIVQRSSARFGFVM